MSQVISWITSNLAEDERQGEARDENQPESISGFVSTLLPGLVISTLYLVAFLATRRSQKRFYAPRTYLGCLQDHERSPELPNGLFSWIITFWRMPDTYALKHQSLDSYLFLRYLRICLTICFVNMCITWPILLPLNITGGNGKSQLELLSYSNININTNSNRLYVHCLLAWVNYGFVMYMITRECVFYINLRQAYLLSPQSAKRISSRTVLFTCVPGKYLNEERVRKTFGATVKKVWLAGDSRNLDDTVKERDEVVNMLEKSQIKLMKKVNKKRNRELREASQRNHNELFAAESGLDVSDTRNTNKGVRPHRRLGFLGLFGQKVDTIDWTRSRLQRLVPEVEMNQRDWLEGRNKKVSAVFVEFHTQISAEAAFQVLTHHHAFHMAPKFIGIRPGEVIWKNLGISWWRKTVSSYLIYAFVALVIVFWAIPVGVVGIVAQVSVLQSLPGLTWIQLIPEQLLGIISSLLPSYVLAWVMSWVPVILNFCARAAGAVSEGEVELFTQSAYFLFQVVQVFLIRTITDTASTAIVQIVQSPTSAFEILAEALPTSSNFYISYFIIQGFTIATDVMTQVVSLVVFNVFYRFFAQTPRAMYGQWTTLKAIRWGSVMPVITGIVIISVAYIVIAPFLLLWSTIGIGIFYQAYRYDVLFVSNTQIDTRGLIYPRALKQLFTGVYLAEICLIGIFIASKAIGQAGLMIVFLVFTILYHMTMSRAIDPLLYNLPCTMSAEEEYQQGLLEPSGDADSTDVEVAPLSKDNRQYSHPKNMEEAIGDGKVTVTAADRASNFLTRFLKPWAFSNYWTLRELVPHEGNFNFAAQYSDEVETTAYLPAAVCSPAPILWIPEDAAGVSKREIAETRGTVAITDEGCTLNEKNKIVWDTVGARPPIWTEKIYY